MTWQKLGQLFCPVDLHPQLCSHAANPLPVHLQGDVYRVLYSGRDDRNRSSVGYVDIDIARQQVLYECREPLFGFGPEGSFYSHGVSIGNCYEADGRRYVLFMGWQYPAGGHWRGDIGRLLLSDDWTLKLDGKGPFLAADELDPVSLSYPWVLPDVAGGYDMWYGSTITWDADNGEMLHVIKHAHSLDGHRWQKTGQAIPSALGVVQAFSHPCVIKGLRGGYDMWFSYRSGSGQSYRIGRAFSPDGRHWENRLDQAGIDVSAAGWDADMIEYPFVLDHQGRRYMFYNGNGNGKTGFGLAVWIDD